MVREASLYIGFTAFLGGFMVLLAPDPPPRPQLTVPCEVIRVIDGDTVEVDVKFRFNVRLLDCWAPEKHATDIPGEKERGLKAAESMRAIAEGKTGVITIPLPGDVEVSLASVFTLGRVLGSVSIDGGGDIAEQQRKQGHAFATKDELTASLRKPSKARN